MQLLLLKTLILWSLSSSDAVQAIIKESYKQARHDDDKNQPLSVQPWGRDGYKRKYWLIEGQDDTQFRLYRENSGITAKTNVWLSVAGTIDEIKAVADRLDEENTPHARNLRDKIRAAIPRFEAGEAVWFSILNELSRSNLTYRGAIDVITDWHEKLLLPGQSQASRYMKAVPEERR